MIITILSCGVAIAALALYLSALSALSDERMRNASLLRQFNREQDGHVKLRRFTDTLLEECNEFEDKLEEEYNANAYLRRKVADFEKEAHTYKLSSERAIESAESSYQQLQETKAIAAARLIRLRRLQGS